METYLQCTLSHHGVLFNQEQRKTCLYKSDLYKLRHLSLLKILKLLAHFCFLRHKHFAMSFISPRKLLSFFCTDARRLVWSLVFAKPDRMTGLSELSTTDSKEKKPVLLAHLVSEFLGTCGNKRVYWDVKTCQFVNTWLPKRRIAVPSSTTWSNPGLVSLEFMD